MLYGFISLQKSYCINPYLPTGGTEYWVKVLRRTRRK